MPIIYLKDSGDFMAEAADAIAAAQIAEGGAKSARDEAEGYAASALDSKTAAAGSAQQAEEAADIANSAAQGERDRIAAEQRRVAAENDRTQMEQARADAENTRVAAETGRGMNETARKDAETDRATAETGRVEQETARQKAETDRSTSENARVSAETARADAEKSRVSAEAERNTAEDTRKTAETERGTAETARETAEEERKDAETARAGAETARAAAEGNRAAAETARATAETARETAEAERGVVLQAHIANEENPHKATAAQIGADPAGAAQVVQGNLTAHMTDAAKHVTAEERTAWNAKETPEGAQAKADAAAQSLKDNPTLVGGIPIVTTFTPEGGTDGADYAITLPSVTALYAGLRITIIPHIASTRSSLRFNINDLGARSIRRVTSDGFAYGTNSRSLLQEGCPIGLIYESTCWLAYEYSQTVATDIRGIVPVGSGGTGLGSDKGGGNFFVSADGNNPMVRKTPEQVATILSPYLPKRTCRFVVGTSTAGWTASDCDYLCDGVDDQVEINAAIQALPETGGEIVILDGTYDIGANITINVPNVSMRGCGRATTILQATNPTVLGASNIISIHMPMNEDTFELIDTHVVISRLGIREYRNDGNKSKIYGITIAGANDVSQKAEILECSLSGFGYGIWATSANFDIRKCDICDCRIVLTASDSAQRTHGGIFSDNYVSYTDAAINAGSKLFNINCKTCRFENNVINGGYQVSVFVNTKFLIKGNVITANEETGDLAIGLASSTGIVSENICVGARPIVLNNSTDCLVYGNKLIGGNYIDMNGTGNEFYNNIVRESAVTA